MGIDIHLFIEERIGNTDTSKDWFQWAAFELERNYAAFGLMADIRGEDHLFDQRGLPNSLGWQIKKEFDTHDYHSTSWLTCRELEQVNEKLTKVYPYEEWDELTAVILAMKTKDPSGDRTRVVFGFDS